MSCVRALSIISKTYCDLTSVHNDRVMIGLDVVTARRENFILWYNDRVHDLVTLNSTYFPYLTGLAHTKPFNTPRMIWMFMPAPAKRRLVNIDHNLWSSSSSNKSGLPLGFPIFKAISLEFFFSFAPVAIFSSL